MGPCQTARRQNARRIPEQPAPFSGLKAQNLPAQHSELREKADEIL